MLFYVLLTVNVSITLDSDQRDAHLLYFTIYLLHSFTCFEHYMLIIRRLNCVEHLVSSSQLVAAPCTSWESSLPNCPPDGH